jgi:SAM-dependent methyltransferase
MTDSAAVVSKYDAAYFQHHREGARSSARAIVPLVMEWVRPRRVIDVGCGTGTWLAVFLEHGVDDVRGIDGAYVEPVALEIPRDRFMAADLREPLHVTEKYDLAVSLEVAEHLPPQCAASLIDSLVGLAPVILFSAAIPGQGGVQHLNEQWPDYWVELFRARGYLAIDCIRPRIWSNPAVDWWYAQNTLLLVRGREVDRYPGLREELASTRASQLAVVHPRQHLFSIEEHRLELTAQEIGGSVPVGSSFILVDQEALVSDGVTAGRIKIPFLERNGQYWGAPPDDETAIRELERLRRGGASYMVFAWPAFWWLDYYAGFRKYLRTRFPCTLENERLVIFRLGPDVPPAA